MPLIYVLVFIALYATLLSIFGEDKTTEEQKNNNRIRRVISIDKIELTEKFATAHADELDWDYFLINVDINDLSDEFFDRFKKEMIKNFLFVIKNKTVPYKLYSKISILIGGKPYSEIYFNNLIGGKPYSEIYFNNLKEMDQ